ncbi:MAG: hypothetical protein ISS70_26570 [Phycisphaerae bacterium]|nr:hypothetical protein [Phycisphaerae bacterium]
MRPAENIKKLISKLHDTSSAEMDERVLGDILSALEESETVSARSQPKSRRTIMKNPITKLAVAATVIAVVVLGLSELINTGSTSGVVWAEVARKVQASRGLIVRCTETTSVLPSDAEYAIKYFSPTHSRTDSYKDGQIVQTFYTDLETMTLTAVFHTHRHYISNKFTKSSEGFLEKNEDWMNPRYLVQTILSCEHRELEQKTIEGVLCEGIETTDPACLGPLPGPVRRLDVEMRLWVNAQTEYPVLFESKISVEAETEAISSECVMDQFQWDVDLDPEIFEPNIPPDYTDMRNL